MGFVPRVDGKVFEGKTFDPVVQVFALVDKYNKTGDSEDDFIITKEPRLVDEYNLDEVVQARAEGCGLKEMIKRVQSGELMPEGRTPQYVDTTKSPQTLEEALEIKVKTEAVLDSAKLGDLSKEDLDELSRVVKMSPEQVKKYVDNLVLQATKSKVVPHSDPVKTEPTIIKDGE